MRPVLWLLIALTLLGGIAWVLLDSGRVAVARVEVTGLDRLSRAEVVHSAGVRVGEPLVLLDTSEVARGITANLAAAHSVEVSRRWPDTVQIDVRERVAVAGVRTGAGVQLLDRDGVAFAVDTELPDGVVTVRASQSAVGARPEDIGSESTPPEARALDGAVPVDGAPAMAVDGEVPAGAAVATVGNAAIVVAALPPRLRDQVVQVTVRSPDAIDLELGDGRTVHWGGPGRSGRKVMVLQALMNHDARAYDVSAPDAPTTRD